MKESLLKLFSCLEKEKISFQVFKNVEKHEESLCEIFACFKIQTKNERRKFKIERNPCKERIKNISMIVEEFGAKLEAVQSAVAISSYVSNKVNIKITDFEEVMKLLEHCKSDKQSVSNLQNDDLWGVLSHALKLSESIKDLWQSVSFKRVAERCWRKERVEKEITLTDLLKFFSESCFKTFSSEWNSFLTKPDDNGQTVQKLEDLVGDDLSSDSLKKEIAIVAAYLDTKSKLKNDCVIAYADRAQILQNIQNTLSALKLLGFDSVVAINKLESLETQLDDKTKLSIKRNYAHVQEVKKYLTENGDTKSVLQQLHVSSEAVKFVQKTINEDLHFMVEEVEEHKEQLKVTEVLVTKLIDVHQFLGKIIKLAQSTTNVKKFLTSLDKLVTNEISVETDIDKIIENIADCNANISSLDGLYNCVANRVEISKAVISKCLDKGKYSVHVSEERDTIAKINYDDMNGEHFLSELQNLRSRAYLISNSAQHSNVPREKRSLSIKKNVNYRRFIKEVNLLTEICDLLAQIRLLEFQKYDTIKWEGLQGTASLQEKKDKLDNDLEKWKSALSDGRSKFCFLNFFRGYQFRVFFKFFRDCSNTEYHNEAISLLKLIDPEITLEKVRYLAQNNTVIGGSPEAIVNGIGDALETAFKDTVPPYRQLDLHSSASISAQNIVKDEEIFIVKLDDDSPQTVNVMLSLYANTCKSFPQAHEILFCSAHTEWEEVELFLNRCALFHKRQLTGRKSLHCMANVDLLKPEIRNRLENRVKNQHLKNRLILICRGKNCNNFFEEFNEYTHEISGMTDKALSDCLTKHFPNVVVYTSALPGLGKTEKIKTDACQKGTNVVTFPVNDSVKWKELVASLKRLSIKSYQGLHFDVGQVDNPSLLDSFLFQLIVLGMVSSDIEMFHLPVSYVYIEVANTLQDTLRNSLQICKYFKSESLTSFKYEDLVVSLDVNSNVQIVCQYLHAHRNNKLEDTDILFRDGDHLKPVPVTNCRKLLAGCLSDAQDLSFTILKTFLAFLADQLRKFSESAYFRIASLQFMLGERRGKIRTNLFEALVGVSKEFSSRSIKTCLSQRNELVSSSNSTITEALVNRVTGMKRWEDTNHLILVFHGRDAQSATVFYRNKDDVPQHVKALLVSQAVRPDGGNQDIPEFNSMDVNELKEKLLRIASTETTNKSHQDNLDSSYAVTADNIHKMILIILRVRGRIPVILMGETGCGKTSLVRYLAMFCRIPFSVFSLHAGIHEEEIVRYIKKKEIDAVKETWIFLDEINTTDHLGLISEIVCHHTLLGRPLSRKLVFLAACNPYRLRSEEQIKTAGLEHKRNTDNPDEYSRLVYRVHPLPEAMFDYVWDFGSLKPEDEVSYIQRMVTQLSPEDQGKSRELLAPALAASQMFLRNAQGDYSVSLRDVNRCITLVKWFKKTLEIIHKYRILNEKKTVDLKEEHKRSDECPLVLKSYILGLAHCYLYRLSTTQLRNDYCEEMAKSLQVHQQTFTAVVRIMEENFLNRMELPPGTCKNSSLRENVFVILVCILNRIPVFVVGKPGCSKSLSMRLIKRNLRGRDSPDAFFKTLPHIYVVSYQSSESSTSEGIQNVFEKARKYAKCNKDILPVVLLDEVGLAGCSKHNPLKVLHSLLEPESSGSEASGQVKPEVAVVGISNWALDAAKMNRAIHLSKPDPDVDDLHNTAISIMCDVRKKGLDSKGQKRVRKLAESYHKYQCDQTYPNFHGLRDYYSLIKNLVYKSSTDRSMGINLSLQRNFGGLPYSEIEGIQRLFLDNGKDDIYPVMTLIQQNLEDPLARHLMLFTKGDFAIDVLSDTLSSTNREVRMIYGSRFDGDQSEEYNYDVLSRILLYMECSCVLILRDLELIYGALYDMLNQSYTTVDGKKMCRVAIGSDCNPACFVHDEFRCIVLKDEKTIDYSDPPFLNRFEKQLLRYSHALNEEQTKIVKDLSTWVDEISRIENLHNAFGPPDMFIGFHEDTLSSLVFSRARNSANENLFQVCKADLMWVASPEGVLRAKKSDLFSKAEKEVESLTEEYFAKPIHRGLAHLITAIKESVNAHPYLTGDNLGSQCVVMTYSATKISDIKCQMEFLNMFSSEKQLAKAVKSFWLSKIHDVLILQCSETDAKNLLLARSVIETQRKFHECPEQKKHVIILIYVDRQHYSDRKNSWQFSFGCGWKLIFLDVLVEQEVSLSQIHSASIQTMLSEPIWPLEQVAKKVLLWCFSCIEYNQEQRDLESTSNIINKLFESETVVRTVEELVYRSLSSTKTNASYGCLQADIACNKEQIVNSSTFFSAIKRHLFDLARVPLAKFIFFMESNNAWPPHLTWVSESKYDAQSDLESLWRDLVLNQSVLHMENFPDPGKCGVYRVDNTLSDLHFPFSHLFSTKMKNSLSALDELEINDGEKLEKFQTTVSSLIPQIVLTKLENRMYRSMFQDDVLDSFSAHFKKELTREQRISILTASLELRVDYNQGQLSPALSFCFNLLVMLRKNKQRLLNQFHMIATCWHFVDEDILSRISWNVSLVDVPASKDEVNQTNNEKESSEMGLRDSEAEKDEDDKFQTLLLDHWSEALLPNPDSIKRNNGLESWIVNVRTFLLFAKRMENSANSVHFLRFCVDFASIILLPSELREKEVHIYNLAKIGKKHNCADKCNYLDSVEVFREISDLIVALARKQKIESELLEAFNAQFFGRCIETNIDMTWIKEIISRVMQVLVRENKNTAAVMIPVLWRILECEKEEICDFLEGSNSCTNLLAIDNVLRELHFSHKDSYACTVICDIIESLFQTDIFLIDLNSGKSDIASIKLARKAVDILSREGAEFIDLKFLIAISYLRAFVISLSKEVSEQPDLLSQEMTIESPLAIINSIFKKKIVGGQEQSPLLIFFLKQLLFRMNVFDFQKMFESSKVIDVITPCFSNKKAEFTFHSDFEKYTEAENAYYQLEHSSLAIVQKANSCFQKCMQQSTKHILAFAELLMKKFFLKRATRKLNDSEARIASWISEQITNLPENESKVLLNALINEEFNDDFLQLSPESNASHVRQALLIVHIACVISIIDENSQPSLLFVCLKNLPETNWKIRFDQGYLKHMEKNVVKSLYEFNKNTIFSCTCGLRVCTTQCCSSCPNCNAKLKHQLDEYRTQNEQQMPQEEVTLTDFTWTTQSILVYANVYAGMALGFTKEQEVENKLQVKKGTGMKHCLQRMQEELKRVAKIVDLTETQVVCLIHLVVQRCQPFLSNMAGMNPQSWLKEFREHATQVLKEMLKQPKKIKECMLIRRENQNGDRATIEQKILELDVYVQQPNVGDNHQLRRLLRMKRIPSLEDFRLYFAMLSEERQAENTFLSLFFSNLDILKKIGHLYHILQWTRYVYSRLNHRITREEAKTDSIKSFMDRSEDKERLGELFKNFKRAWQAVRKDVNSQLKKGVKEMPNLNEISLDLTYCIIDENNEKGKYLHKAITFLASAQNQFLDQSLWIAASENSHALGFLHLNSNYATIPRVSLQVARKEDIIYFQWQDELHNLPYSYNDFDYGMGEIVYYDVERISERLAESLVFGRRYLDFKLDRFIFSNEFFNSCSELLTEIQKLIPQSNCLPEEIGMNPFSEHKREDCQDLLAHLEMLMFLLRRIPSVEIDMSLLSFITKREKILPSKFPVSRLPKPSESIKVSHIVPLCEELEHKLADGAIDGLPDTFRHELTNDLRKKLRNLFESLEKHKISLVTFHKVLRRFLFRNYFSPNFTPEKTLSACISNNSLWTSAEVMPSAEIYPNEVTLKYLHATMTTIDEMLKVNVGIIHVFRHIDIWGFQRPN